MKRLFGTDGVRARTGEFPLDPATIRRLGEALGRFLPRAGGGPPAVLIGRDTRESGPEIEAALAGGLRAAGARAETAGVVTTPCLAWLTREGGFAAGAMISASHNPFHDNGIKILGADGMKLADAREAEIERLVLDGEPSRPGAEAPAPEPGPAPLAGGLDGYLDHLRTAAGGAGALAGLSVVLDCAHGSAARIAPELFASLGAAVRAIGCEPDGRNINDGCGSLHLGPLCREVVASGADLGIAFDGDADRCLAVDRTGRPLDGDFILYVHARSLSRRGSLREGLVVATVMSNLWLEKALEQEGLRLLRTQVGDKYVLERMLETRASLGGEQSGHIIFLDHFPSGDGILTGLLLAAALRTEGLDLAAVADGIRRYPQVLLNVRVRERAPLDSHPVIGPAARSASERLAGTGRLLLRYSGTEPLARVMVEGSEDAMVQEIAGQLAELIRRELGAEP